MQSTSHIVPPGPSHVAIIMDGNGRWAATRGLPRVAGHDRGIAAVRRTVEAAPALGITTLTMFAFSADNWQRPPSEVRALMRLFARFLVSERRALVERGVRLSVIGRRDRLPRAVVATIAAVEAATRAGERLRLRLAIDFSGRDAIVEAAVRAGDAAATRDGFARRLAETYGGDDAGDVDLLVRTGGEQRLSDFLLWESAYAELHFTACLWPDFGADDLAAAVADFRVRQRRFGALPKPAARGSEDARAHPGNPLAHPGGALTHQGDAFTHTGDRDERAHGGLDHRDSVARRKPERLARSHRSDSR